MKNVDEITSMNPAIISNTIITFIPNPVKLLQIVGLSCPF